MKSEIFAVVMLRNRSIRVKHWYLNITLKYSTWINVLSYFLLLLKTKSCSHTCWTPGGATDWGNQRRQWWLMTLQPHTHTHTHTHSLSLSLTHTHTHTHKQLHWRIRCCDVTHPRLHSSWWHHWCPSPLRSIVMMYYGWCVLIVSSPSSRINETETEPEPRPETSTLQPQRRFTCFSIQWPDSCIHLSVKRTHNNTTTSQ